MATKFDLRGELSALEAQGLYRRRRTVDVPDGARRDAVVFVDGREYINFCSNDYLGLANHPRVTAAFASAARKYGVGSGASHLITGHSYEHQILEERLAAFTGRPRALLFSTGYMANLGAIGALLGRGDTVLEDRLNHASLLDAGLLSGARFIRYKHADAMDVQRLLAERDSGRCLVVTDGVFSMDGDTAPLQPLADAARAHGAWLMVDDAHGLGVLGATGRGTLQAQGITGKQVPLLMGTLGKALGSFGAFIAGDEELIEFLIQKARTYIYTTALPPAIAAATSAALELIDSESWRRTRVLEHVERFRRHAEGLLAALPNTRLGESNTPIQPLILGNATRATAVSQALWARGLWVSAIRPPTVAAGSARLRIAFSAAHNEAQIDRLLETLAEVLPQHP